MKWKLFCVNLAPKSLSSREREIAGQAGRSSSYYRDRTTGDGDIEILDTDGGIIINFKSCYSRNSLRQLEMIRLASVINCIPKTGARNIQFSHHFDDY